MALISSIGAGIYTSLTYKADEATPVTLPTTQAENEAFIDTDSSSLGFFGSATTPVNGIREFPQFGAPANIVNVPVYGQSVSDQISGQSDAPTFEITVNYIPSEHAALQALVESQVTQVFQIRLRNAESATADDATFYIKGRVASFLVSPNLTDSNQATISIATQGEYVGPFATTA